MRSRIGVSCAAFVLMVVVSSPVFAEPRFALKGGLVWSGLRGERDGDFFPTEKTDSRTAFVIGGGVSFTLNDLIDLEPELLFVQRGESVRPWPLFFPLDCLAAVCPEADFTTSVLHVRTSYLDVPLLVKVLPFGRDGLAPSLYAGPTLSFRLDADYVAEVGDLSMEFDADEQFEGFHLGLALGASVELTRSLLLDARYVHGLGDADASPERQRWGSGMLLAGFRF